MIPSMEALESLKERVDAFLALEEDTRLLEWEEYGLKVWPIIRTSLFFRLLTDSNIPAQKGKDIPVHPKEYIQIIKSMWSAIHYQGHHRAVVFSDATYRRFETMKGWLDVTYDLLASVVGDAVFFEKRHFMDFEKPHWSSRVIGADGIEALALAKASASSIKKRIASRVPEQIFSLLQLSRGSSVGAVELTAQITYNATRSIASYSIYRRLLERIRPRIVFVNCASYGGSKAILCKACHDLGIITVEAQHGVVNQYHPAYNYGSAAAFFHEYLPDYFLVYGVYWANLLKRYPPVKVVIGNPFMDEWKAVNRMKRNDYANTVLFVSQPEVSQLVTEYLIRAAQTLSRNYRLVFRPHPAELVSEEQERRLHSVGAVIDRTSHIYELLSRCGKVVGSHSTVLFEARAFCNQVLVLDSPKSRAYIPVGFGRFIANSTELIEAIQSNEGCFDHMEDSSLWAPNWRQNFADFLSMCNIDSSGFSGVGNSSLILNP
ncbi:MAG TPA: hypothetical protein GX507_00225 [Clostridia bacterium]|nr:hypothetical protein [Clostridia bacterium]